MQVTADVAVIDKDRAATVLVAVDWHSGLMFATRPPKKGPHALAVINFRQYLQRLGDQDSVIRSDGEPALPYSRAALRIPSTRKCAWRSRRWLEEAIRVLDKPRTTTLLAMQFWRLLYDVFFRNAEHDSLVPDRLRHATFLLSHFHVRSCGANAQVVVTGVSFHGKLACF